MGGYGPGNWYRWDSKRTTESLHRIDICWLKSKAIFGLALWVHCRGHGGMNKQVSSTIGWK
jgi:hypothetical protein